SLFMLICAWSIALILDSSYWYNRNLCIIANIERLFLEREDLRHVHYYFGAHRTDNRMITTLKVQYYLSIGIGILVLVYHFFERVVPGFGRPWFSFEVVRTLPYVFAVVSVLILRKLKRKRDSNYAEFLSNSPGITVDTSGIRYGGGHGFDK